MDALLAAVADDLEDDTAGEPLLQGVARFYNDPVGFIDECVTWPPGRRLAPYQREVLAAIPEKRRVSVRGPHGLGKSAIAEQWECSPGYVRRLARSGRIAGRRTGHGWLIDRASVERGHTT
jgi:excisionase family DNA binding protein